jgi:hypothetical protein
MSVRVKQRTQSKVTAAATAAATSSSCHVLKIQCSQIFSAYRNNYKWQKTKQSNNIPYLNRECCVVIHFVPAKLKPSGPFDLSSANRKAVVQFDREHVSFARCRCGVAIYYICIYSIQGDKRWTRSRVLAASNKPHIK